MTVSMARTSRGKWGKASHGDVSELGWVHWRTNNVRNQTSSVRDWTSSCDSGRTSTKIVVSHGKQVVFVDRRSSRLIRPVVLVIHRGRRAKRVFKVVELRYEVQSKICGDSVCKCTIRLGYGALNAE